MENATKALLIAASILIVIVLIAVGVLLIKNTSSTNEDAKKVGNSISIASGNAASDALGSIKGTIISKKKFNSFFTDMQNKGIRQVLNNEQDVELCNQIEVIGYYCKTMGKTIIEDTLNGSSDSEAINKLADLYKTGRIGLVPYPTVIGSLEQMTNTVVNKAKIESNSNFIRYRIYTRFYFEYDEWGYVNKAVYVVYMERF